MEEKIKILIAKPGLDGHDRGAKVVARAFRDAGFEVIYTGLRQTPEQIVNAAIEEDVDAIGVSILSGAHNHCFLEIMSLLKNNGVDDMMVFGGGIIPESDVTYLKSIGVAEIFGPGTPTDDTIKFVKANVSKKE
jgi:methylmalonyl-CoA mutase, C-terminal domain